jgi:hypothetical protein
VVDAGAFSGLTTTSTSALINTYSFTTKTSIGVGDPYEGGYLICQASSIRWVVSPYSAEICASWYCRNDANTRAQEVSGCTGWFVPTCGQLQNPGYLCRSFWGPSPCYNTSCPYWSSTESTEFSNNTAWAVSMYNGGPNNSAFKSNESPIRSFRCVTY